MVEVSRRGFMSSVAVVATAAALRSPSSGAAERSSPSAAGPDKNAAAQNVRLVVNGTPHDLSIEPRVTLLDALRDHVGLTGTKKGCDRGQCGACTVLIDGRRVNACLTLAIMVEGAKITTVEGLAEGAELGALQAAFVEHDAFQCGYCTPGQLCSATALLAEIREGQPSAVTDLHARNKPLASDDEIRERMSGNLCRCGAYPNIVAAIRAVASART